MKQTLIIIAALLLGGFTYWALSPLFIDKEVQDTLDPILEARLEAQRKVDAARSQQTPTDKTTTTETASEETQRTPEPLVTVEESFGIKTHGPFPIVDTPGHPATGVVEIIESPEEKLVYYKDYDGTNGPDLKVYLSKDLEASEIFDLGDARGNQGNLIYGVPLNVDFSEYNYVLTWCEAFGVLFDYAEIN